MPLQVIEGKGVGDSIDIYASSSGKYRIYELPRHETLDSNGIFIYDSLKYEYIIYNSEKDFGYLLKNLNDLFNKRINKDSILKKRAFNAGDGKQIISDSMNLKEPFQIIATANYRIDRYFFKSGIYDSAYFIYDKNLNDFPFSWSYKLDEKYGLKFCKLLLFIKHDTTGLNSNLKEFYRNSYEIEKDTSKNEEELKQLIDRFIEFEKSGYK